MRVVKVSNYSSFENPMKNVYLIDLTAYNDSPPPQRQLLVPACIKLYFMSLSKTSRFVDSPKSSPVSVARR